MKKVVYSLLIVFGVILVTGCGKEVDFSKTDYIVCSKYENKGTNNTNTILTFSYDQNEKIDNFMIESDINYNDAVSKQASEVIAKTMRLISKTLGLSFKSQVEDKRLYYSFSGNINTFKTLMKQLDKSYNEDKIKGDTKQEAIDELTKDGYTCHDIKK